MSKSRDLFIALGTCVFGVLLIASNFADRFVTQLPEGADVVAEEFDFDFKMIAAASASAFSLAASSSALIRAASASAAACAAAAAAAAADADRAGLHGPHW